MKAETKQNPELDIFFEKLKTWKPEMLLLREIVLSTGLQEEKKWWQPVYTFNGSNLAIIGGFKDSCVLSFFKGVLLKDDKQILEFPGENSQSAKVVRFTNVEKIKKLRPTLIAYLKEAIELEKAGIKVQFKKIEEHPLPEELSAFFKKMPELKKAFETLTPGRQRSYLLHFSSATKTATKTARIEKNIPRILEGKGIND